MNKLLQMLDGKLYIETWDEVKNEPWEVRKAGMSDYGLANGGWASSSYNTPSGQPTCWHSLASRSSDYIVYCLYFDGDNNYNSPGSRDAGVVPALRLNLQSKDIINRLSAEELFGCEIFVGTVKYRDNEGKA